MSPLEIISCFIPECFNTSENPVGKRFVRVPCLPKLRQLWIKAGLRLKIKVPIVDRSPMYCCEDHFDLQYDATKQWLQNDRYENGHFIKLKRGVVPHIFPSRQKTSNNKTTKKKSVSTSEDKKAHDESCDVVIKEEPLDYDDCEEELDDTEEYPSDKSSEDVLDSNACTDGKTSEDADKIDMSPKECNEAGKSVNKSEPQLSLNENKKTRKKINSMKSSENIFKINNKDGKDVENESSSEMLVSESVSKIDVKNKKEKGDAIHIIDKIEIAGQDNQNQNDGKFSKRKLQENEGTCENSQGEITEKGGSKKKKRKVVKEILAWIPSDPSVVNQLRTPNCMQPFIVVQTPPSTPGTAPILQLSNQQAANGTPSVTSVPLDSGKETQFILTVPDKFPFVGPNGQQLVLAVPQGCSFSVDKLPINSSNNSKEQSTNSPSTSTFVLTQPNIMAGNVGSSTTTSSLNNNDNDSSIPTNPVISGSISDHTYELPESIEKTPKSYSQKLKDSLKKSKPKNNPSSIDTGAKLSEVAAVAPTSVASPMIKFTATSNSTASQPSSCSCSVSSANRRSSIDTSELFDGNDKLSNSLQYVVDEFSTMKRAVTNLTKELQGVKAENNRLKTHNRILLEQKNAQPQPDETRKLELAAEALKGIFTSNQIRILLGPRNDKGRVKWTESEMDLAYGLSRISSNAYKYLLNNLKYPFPSITTLKRYTEKSKEIMEETLRGVTENHQYLCDDFKSEDMTTEDDALARAILDADSDEELERDEGAIRLMEEIEKKRRLKRVMDLEDFSDKKELEKVPTFRRVTIDKTKSEIGKRIVKIDPQKKIIIENSNKGHKLPRVSVPHSPAITQLLSEDSHIIPKIVEISRASLSKNKNPILKETVRIKKELSLTDSKDNICIQNQILTANTPVENITRRKIVKLPVKIEKSLPSEKFLVLKHKERFSGIQEDSIHSNSLSENQILIIENPEQTVFNDSVERQVETIGGELVLSNDSESIVYSETDYDRDGNDKIVSNVAELVELNGSSKMIRIQVDSVPGEDGILCEEVVIHCDDPEMFSQTAEALNFQQDALETSSFL